MGTTSGPGCRRVAPIAGHIQPALPPLPSRPTLPWRILRRRNVRVGCSVPAGNRHRTHVLIPGKGARMPTPPIEGLGLKNAYERAEAGSMLRAPSDLFGHAPAQRLPQGFKYRPELIEHSDEME